MNRLLPEVTVLRSPLFRPVWLPAIITTALLLLTLALLLGMSWRSEQRLQPVRNHLAEISRLQETSLHVQAALIENLDGASLDVTDLQALRARVLQVLALDRHLVPATRERLQRAEQALGDLADEPRRALIATLMQIRLVIAAEIQAHDRLLEATQRDSQMEFRIAAVAMLGLPLLGLLTLYFLRNRIWVPLNDLGSFMSLLAQQDYKSVPTKDVDPLLLPLFDHYNGLVTRLAELERQHQSRQKSLENEVRTATRTLLEHQRDLANAERLAAVGEVAAGLAHELRNPMAGIQMALGNLRRDLSEPDQAARLDLVIAELRRVTRLLNDLLAQSQQIPEPIVTLRLADTVQALLGLARYQVSDRIRLHQEIRADLCCGLPEGRLRQALLNLIVNAAQSIGDQAGSVTVSATVADTTLRIAVSDDGPGFPAELLQSGVRSFATWRESGTGLGLAMVRRFARDLGGELRLANCNPRGARVTLELPCRDCHV